MHVSSFMTVPFIKWCKNNVVEQLEDFLQSQVTRVWTKKQEIKTEHGKLENVWNNDLFF